MWWIWPSSAGITNVSSTWAPTRRPASEGFVVRSNRALTVSPSTLNSGAVAAGPLWAQYMKTIHKNLAPIKFPKPASGLYYMNVDAETGLLPSGEPGEKVITELFLEGSGPTEVSNLARFRQQRDEALASNIQDALAEMGGSEAGNGMDLNLNLNLDLNMDLDQPTPQSPNLSN